MIMQEFDDSKLYEPITGNKWWDVGNADSVQNQWYMVAISYKNAADLLVDGLPNRLLLGPEQVYIACPIMFLYRHYLEVGLKGLMLDLQALRKQKGAHQNIPTQHADASLPGHPLMQSWRPVKALLIELDDESNACDDAFEKGNAVYSAIEERITDFDVIDAGSFNFRYPVGRKNQNPILSALPDVQELRRLKEIIGAIACNFGSFETWVHEQKIGTWDAWHQF